VSSLRPSRRSILHAALGGAAGLALPLAGCGRAPGSNVELMVSELADGVVLIAGAGGNVVAARGPDGILMIDGGRAEHADVLARAAADALGTRTVAALINTHWHPDQTGSNARLGRARTPIIAHENTRLWLTQTIERPWEDFAHEPAPPEALPTETFYDTFELALGAERASCGYMLQAHTDGDIWARLENANVLVAGGVASGAGWPEIDWWTGGWIGVGGATLNANLVTTSGGMVSGLARLVALADEDTQIVPAHGRVLRRADLESQVAMYGEIAQALRDMLFKGFGPEDVLAAAPTAAYDAEMGDSERFLTLAFQSLWGHFAPDA
jgi:glyoxylase-like metal-dependent hydrolase (beta-lactamase superfamily II)